MKAETVFVRTVTALVWFCLFPFAPLYLYLFRWVPITVNRLWMAGGCAFVMIVPMAAPQSGPAQITEREVQQLYRRQEQFGELIGGNQMAISSLNARVVINEIALTEMREDISKIRDQMTENGLALASISANTKSTADDAEDSQTLIVAMGLFVAAVFRFGDILALFKKLGNSSKFVGGIILVVASWFRHKMGG